MPSRGVLGARVLAVLASVATAGCVVLSVDSVLTDQSTDFDPSLLGTWVADSGGDSLVVTFARAAADTYAVELVSYQGWDSYLGLLGHLGRWTLIDIRRRPGEESDDLTLPLHAIVRLDRGPGRLELRMLRGSPLREAIDHGEIPLRYLHNNDNTILIDRPEVMRNGLDHYLVREDIWDDETTFRRATAADSAWIANVMHRPSAAGRSNSP